MIRDRSHHIRIDASQYIQCTAERYSADNVVSDLRTYLEPLNDEWFTVLHYAGERPSLEAGVYVPEDSVTDRFEAIDEVLAALRTAEHQPRYRPSYSYRPNETLRGNITPRINIGTWE